MFNRCTRYLAGVNPLKNLCLQNEQRIGQVLQESGVLTRGQGLRDFMVTNKMASQREQVFDVFQRASSFLANSGSSFHTEEEINDHYQKFLYHTSAFEIILGSPILTNGGKENGKSVSACSIPPVHLGSMASEEIAQMVGEYHSRGMGTGFSLDDVEDPVAMVKYLNEIAIQEVQQGKIERSVGNMGVLSIEHPKVLEFIRLKTDSPEIKEWKFNLSVNMTDDFLSRWKAQDLGALALMRQIAENAHANGDPGLVFMDRINTRNKTPQVGSYKTVVTCGEVALFSGEVCQFAYLNLPQFLEGEEINREKLREAVHTSVLLLDNAVEANSERMPNEQSADIIASLRRIGVGLCGFAEVLQAMGLPYDSPMAREFAENVMSFINFESKCASIALAKQRGPFAFFNNPLTQKDLFIDPFAKSPTDWVPEEKWQELQKAFATYKIRNVSTTILPPSGRSSLMSGTTPSIEPPFRLVLSPLLKKSLETACQRDGYTGSVEDLYALVKKTGSLKTAPIPKTIRDVFKTAQEVDPMDHVKMMKAFQKCIDEGIYKTINLPNDATVEEVEAIFSAADDSELLGVTIYRDGCRDMQPKALSNEESTSTLVDALYGPIHTTKRVKEIALSPLLQRLKGVHQNGVHYLVDPRLSATRYEHSVGVMALAKMLGADEKTMIAALLHDVSHSAFSHLVDAVFDHPGQDYHEEKREPFLSTSFARETIQSLQITEEEMDHNSIPLIKAKKGLTIDRLDYLLRDLRAVNLIYHPEYSAILNQLAFDEGTLKCKNIETALAVFKKFLQVNKEVYFNPQAEVATITMKTILQEMIGQGLLKEEDFLKTDEEILDKVLKGPFAHIFNAIGPDMPFTTTSDPSAPAVRRKLRYVDPEITGLSGALTDHSDEARKLLEEYLKTPTTVHYKIPVLEGIT